MIPRRIRWAWLLALILPLTTVQGAPGRGGGRVGGGGGMRGGGFGGAAGGMRGGGFGGAAGGMRGGGGFSRSPAISSPRLPSAGGGFGGINRPSAFPSGGGNRPTSLPNRPSTLPNLPNISRPGTGGGTNITRPGTGSGGININRPGIGGGGANITRPGTGGGGININRPGIGSGNINTNRPGIGGGNTINRGNVNSISNRVNNQAWNRVGVGTNSSAWGVNRWSNPYWGYHRGWVNGYWHGNNINSNWNWGSFALGTMTGMAAWGLGSSIYNWGYMPYSNPFLPVAVPVAVAGAAPMPAAVPFDYSQPIQSQAAPPEPSIADQAMATFDSGRAAFFQGNYTEALTLTDQALAQMPNDATLHEFRALCLFALQQYDAAAAPLYAVLAVGPGWDWTTLIGLYPDVDAYTQQLRALEAFVKANPNSPAGHFVLAYHYLTQGYSDTAVSQLQQVVALAPNDTLSAQLIKLISGSSEPPAEAPPAPASLPAAAAPAPVQQGDLPGDWSAQPAPGTTIKLSIRADGSFTWKVTNQGKAQDMNGEWSLTNGVLTLAQSDQGGALVGNVTSLEAKQFHFRVLGTGPSDPGLTFTR